MVDVELAVVLVDFLHLRKSISPTQFTSADEFVQGTGPRGVDHSQTRYAIDQTKMLQLDERFPECARVTQVSPGHDDPVRNLPLEPL